MNKNKKILLSVVAFLLVALIATGVVLKIKHDREMEALRIYNETYLVMDGVEYLRASTELDLSGLQITELEKLTEQEKQEQKTLREEYLTDFRATFSAQLDSTVIQYPDGSKKHLKKD